MYMDITVDLIFKIVVLGLATWALRSLIMERTKKRRAGEQFLTGDEIKIHCIERHAALQDNFTAENKHLKELIEKDLAHGKERFDKIDKKIEEMPTRIIQLLRANGFAGSLK